MANLFTDSEYRLLLSALSRERKICREIDLVERGKVHSDAIKLVPLIDSIEKKIKKIQYNK